MHDLLPAILTETADAFRERLTFPGLWRAGMTAHVDVLDGSMFHATCFCDPTALHAPACTPHPDVHTSPRPTPSSLSPARQAPSQERGLQGLPMIELHCMVRNPLVVIERWKALIPETTRAIIHAEIDRPIDDMLHRIHALELEAGVALCPETATTCVEALPDLVDRVLLMGIEPGASGRPFLGEPILAKAKRLRALFPTLHISIDGGVTEENITGMYAAGASSVVAASAIWNTPDPTVSYEHLIHAISSSDS